MSSNKLHTFPMISTFKAPGINFTRTIENLHKAECLSAGRRAGEAFFCEAEGIEKFGGQSAGSKKKPPCVTGNLASVPISLHTPNVFFQMKIKAGRV